MKKTKNYKLKTKKLKKSAIHLLVFNFYLLTLLLPFSLFGQSPSQTENYVMSKEYLDSIGESSSKKTNIVYLDGLGREKQTVSYKATPGSKDLIIHYDYDEFGRQTHDYLPAPSQQATGQIVSNPLTSVYDPYYNGEFPAEAGIYFSEKELEESLLSRPLKQAAPGNAWQLGGGKEIKFEYRFNNLLSVKVLKASASWNSSNKIYNIGLRQDLGTYDKNTLNVVSTTDENGNRNHEYTNKFGQMILQRKHVTSDNVAGRAPDDPPVQVKTVDTYYVYDNYGNLTYVIPPLAAEKATITQAILDELCYQYKYDGRNRLAERKLPGKEWEYMVYDQQDRLVATQDGEMRRATFTLPGGSTGTSWAFTKYDAFGRVVYTGIYKGTETRAALQTLVDGYGQNNETRQTSSPFTQNGVSVYYTRTNAFPKSHTASNTDLLTVNYYDTSYANLTVTGVTVPEKVGTPGQGEYKVRQGTTTSKNQSLKGLPIASYVRVIPGNTWERNYTFYDRRSRPVYAHKVNHLGGYTKTETIPDFRGKPKHITTWHKQTGTAIEVKVKNNFGYDIQERLTLHTQQINDATHVERIFQNKYNELGRLNYKTTGNAILSSALQKVDYTYNIRGWLTDINDIGSLSEPGQKTDLFAFRINYNDRVPAHFEGTGIKPLFNGNIAETYWKTASDGTLRGYGYVYDELNRMKDAVYQKPGTTVPTPGNFDEYLAYDLNGNITALNRYSAELDMAGHAQLTDELEYTYGTDSNELRKVKDHSGSDTGFKDGTNTANNDYAYDSNANLVLDRNKGIMSIKYNHLNLPVEILWSGTRKINYLYTATGQKVKKTVTDGSTIKITDYLDGFQYSSNVLEFFPHAEGYVKATAMDFGGNISGYKYNYVFNHSDHLGNVRVSYAKDPQTGNLKILDENHYYPFGLRHSKYAQSGFVIGIGYQDVILAPITDSPYKYKYNGKELQDELGLNMYDMDMRMYDPAIARWVVMDPVIHHSMSPYNAFDNNPVFWADPSGADSESNNDSGGGYSTGVTLAFGVSLDSVINGGAAVGFSGNLQSVGGGSNKTNSAGSESGNKSQIGRVSASGEGFDHSLFDSDPNNHNPDVTLLPEVVVRNSAELNAGLENRANQALAIWSNTGTNNYFNQMMWGVGVGATALEHSSTRFYIGTARPNAPVNFLGQKYYGNGRTFLKGANIGRAFGYAGFGAGLLMDTYGVFQYYNNPGSSSAVHPGKAGVNTAVGIYGMRANPAVGILYGGLEAFYPGGTVGAMSDYSTVQSAYRDTNNGSLWRPQQ